MTNPFEDALHFLLHDVLRRGDGPSSAQAQKHIEAINAAQDLAQFQASLKEEETSAPANPGAAAAALGVLKPTPPLTLETKKEK
jgi:hypothetical protein